MSPQIDEKTQWEPGLGTVLVFIVSMLLTWGLFTVPEFSASHDLDTIIRVVIGIFVVPALIYSGMLVMVMIGDIIIDSK